MNISNILDIVGFGLIIFLLIRQQDLVVRLAICENNWKVHNERE